MTVDFERIKEWNAQIAQLNGWTVKRPGVRPFGANDLMLEALKDTEKFAPITRRGRREHELDLEWQLVRSILDYTDIWIPRPCFFIERPPRSNSIGRAAAVIGHSDRPFNTDRLRLLPGYDLVRWISNPPGGSPYAGSFWVVGCARKDVVFPGCEIPEKG